MVFYPSCVRVDCRNKSIEEIASEIAAIFRKPVIDAAIEKEWDWSDALIKGNRRIESYTGFPESRSGKSKVNPDWHSPTNESERFGEVLERRVGQEWFREVLENIVSLGSMLLCVCVWTPLGTRGNDFWLDVQRSMSQKQAVRWCGFRSFPKFPFLVFQLRHVRFANFTLTTLPIFNISISDKFQSRGSGSHFQARANEDLGSVDVQTYLQFSDMACG